MRLNFQLKAVSNDGKQPSTLFGERLGKPETGSASPASCWPARKMVPARLVMDVPLEKLGHGVDLEHR